MSLYIVIFYNIPLIIQIKEKFRKAFYIRKGLCLCYLLQKKYCQVKLLMNELFTTFHEFFTIFQKIDIANNDSLNKNCYTILHIPRNN